MEIEYFIKTSPSSGIKKLIISFIEELDVEFSPSIISRVGNLEEYVDKLLTKAEIYYSMDNNKICNLLVFYCNDMKNLNSYITFLGVARDYRAQGIGKRLIELGIKKSIEAGMKSISLETSMDNEKALRLYKKVGFEITRELEIKNRIIMTKKLTE